LAASRKFVNQPMGPGNRERCPTLGADRIQKSEDRDLSEYVLNANPPIDVKVPGLVGHLPASPKEWKSDQRSPPVRRQLPTVRRKEIVERRAQGGAHHAGESARPPHVLQTKDLPFWPCFGCVGPKLIFGGELRPQIFAHGAHLRLGDRVRQMQ